MVVMQSITFVVKKISPIKYVSKGAYIECETDKGKIAIWGSSNNMTNIQKVQNANTPFTLTSDRYVNPSWIQHKYWIPESANIVIK
ncbi:TPA: hypothetical protein HA335_01620 [Methanocaldococcus jannaschii]|uniref:Uncharacterized protein n=1 Tax=Methanocaldococcus jannaschii TaxID=2190 RepID=A0A832WKR7_9EURY|nr:hypothetical protein [Methanocaldococcus jannaschii]HII59271.1 hypothetical protein [Methanocaldococcus jannaschii]